MTLSNAGFVSAMTAQSPRAITTASCIFLRDIERDDEGRGKEKGAGGKIQIQETGQRKKIGLSAPDPGGPESNLCAERAAAQGVDVDAGGGGNDALNGQGAPSRRPRSKMPKSRKTRPAK